MKRSFFQEAVVSILLYGCTTWMLTKCMEKKLDGNYTRILRAILNKSWMQYPTKQQLYGHLPSITKTIKIRRTRHTGHYWRSRDELISDVLLWTPLHGWAKAARTYIQQLCADTGCSLEDLPEAMDDREVWRERVWVSVLIVRHDDVFPNYRWLPWSSTFGVWFGSYVLCSCFFFFFCGQSYIIKEWFFYINHSSLIIFYHSISKGFELFGS